MPVLIPFYRSNQSNRGRKVPLENMLSRLNPFLQVKSIKLVQVVQMIVIILPLVLIPFYRSNQSNPDKIADRIAGAIVGLNPFLQVKSIKPSTAQQYNILKKLVLIPFYRSNQSNSATDLNNEFKLTVVLIPFYRSNQSNLYK